MAGVLLHLLHGVGDELVGVHLVEVLHVTVVQQIGVGLHFLEVEQSSFFVRFIPFILLIPIEDVVLFLPFSGEASHENFSELVVVWRLVEFVREHFLDERQEGQGFG